jgi:hypothetical protein
MKNSRFPTAQSFLFPPLLFFAVCLMLLFQANVSAQQTLCQQVGNFIPDVVVGTVGGTTNASSLTENVWFNKKVDINGTFVINKNFQIEFCTLRMGNGATIRVEGNNSFSTASSKYFNCNGFWTGILVASAGSSFVYIQGCHIEDSRRAVHVINAASLVYLIGNRFNRNRDASLYVDGIPLSNTYVCLG